MSIMDKVVATVTPPESEETRSKARAKARASAGKGDWLAMVLNHHEQVEAAFASVKAAADPASRVRTLKKLSILLTGHSVAEEAALYPALAKADEEGSCDQSVCRAIGGQIAVGPTGGSAAHESRIRWTSSRTSKAPLAHHVYEEESSWFLDLKAKTPAADQVKLTQRYQEQFARYMGDDSDI